MKANNGHAEREHALLSASGANRWMNCTPSARLEDKMPRSSSKFADEGTFAHELAEVALFSLDNESRATIRGKWCEAKQKELMTKEGYSDEMQEYVNFYASYVQERLSEYKDASLLIEQKIDLSNIIEQGKGTCDAVIVTNGRIIVIDLKYGKGVRVNAHENAQLKLYAYGAYRVNELNFDLDETSIVELVIVQPRLDHVSTYELPAADLIEWAEGEVREKAKLAYAGEGDCNPGDWCKFCRVAGTCRALAEKCTEDVREDFADQARTLTDDEIAALLAKRPLINGWLNALEEYTFAKALEGHQWPGYKLVEGRTNRKWADETKVAETLTAKGFTDIYKPQTLLGIGAIETLVGKKNFPDLLGSLVVKPEGAPTLVEESDKRPALSLNAADDFKND